MMIFGKPCGKQTIRKKMSSENNLKWLAQQEKARVRTLLTQYNERSETYG